MRLPISVIFASATTYIPSGGANSILIGMLAFILLFAILVAIIVIFPMDFATNLPVIESIIPISASHTLQTIPIFSGFVIALNI